MFLQRLYTDPGDLFQFKDSHEVHFVEGLNFIFGRKDTRSKDSKVSLNSIGKSTLLDFLDFCMLGSFNSTANPRLYAAKELMQNYAILLDFTINDKPYTIRRSISKPNTIEFNENGIFEKYSLNKMKLYFGHLLFRNDSYQGVYSDAWYRSLMSFYLKVQRTKKPQFNDPIMYLKDVNADTLLPYHLFLLGIDNSLPVKNIAIQKDLRLKDPALRELRNVFKSVYGYADISEIEKRQQELRSEVSTIADAISHFRLGESYRTAEEKVNELTKNIKKLQQENFQAKRNLSLSTELPGESDINTEKVENIYKKIHVDLGMEVKKSLDEVLSFRRMLAENKKDMLSERIKEIEATIKQREQQIEVFEKERAELFRFLSEQKALTDFEVGIENLNKKRKDLNELEGQLSLYHSIINEKSRLEQEERDLERLLVDYVKDMQPYVGSVSEMFAKVYNALYPEKEVGSSFAISLNNGRKSKLDITVKLPGDFGTGKNQGRTLIYDLTIMLNAINHHFPGPRFLVHDGIFDTVDKAHFIELCNFITGINKGGYKFQYIVTLNEEGTLSESFGRSDLVLPEQIERKAVAVLTPVHTLLGKTF